MTRITDYAPPPAVADLMARLLYTRKASPLQRSNAAFTRRGLQPDTHQERLLSQRDLRPLLAWMIQYGPAAWQGANAAKKKLAILESIHHRTFAAEFWKEASLLSDHLEIAYPTVTRPAEHILDPTDPDEIHNSRCTYDSRSLIWPYAQASYAGWPPLPGWQCHTDAEHWFIDDWHAQRSLTFWLPRSTRGGYRRPWLLHLQGQIEAKAERSGLKVWYAPVVNARFAYSKSSAEITGTSVGGFWTQLTNGALLLPGSGADWQYTLDLDEVLNLQFQPDIPWFDGDRYLNLKVSTRAPCGKYRAANAWASCQMDLTARVYYPALLG